MVPVYLIAICIMMSMGGIALQYPGHAHSEVVNTLTFFPHNYTEARNNFIAAVNAQSGVLASYKCPTAGPEGESLFIDVASFGEDNPEVVIVLSSGTHGVEGFTGSALQTGLLQLGVTSRLPPKIGLVMIHSINPYGMAHLRRMNEDNVDLNRNFIDHEISHPVNEGYSELADSIAPVSLSLWSNISSLIRISWFVVKNGKVKLVEAVSKGQYSHPQGLFYGGNTDAWSNLTLREIIFRLPMNAKQVVIIDVHTGLGKYGNAKIIMNVDKDTPSFKRAIELWGDRVETTKDKSVSVDTYGALKLALPQFMPQKEVTEVSLEFGTFSRFKVFWALRTENWLHHHGGRDDPDFDHIKENLLRVFYPADKEWQEMVWKQGLEIVDQTFAGLYSARNK